MVFSDDHELMDVVDEHDRIIGTGDRKEIHNKGLLHRSVHIFVVDPDGRMYLQKRSLYKQEHPGKWDSSAAGHVRSGESYDEAAARELAEELNLRARVSPVLKIPASQETGGEHSTLYCVQCDRTTGIPEPNPLEIEEGRFFTPGEIEDLCMRTPEVITPSFRLLYGEYQRRPST